MKRLALFLLLGPIFPTPAAAFTPVGTTKPNAYMVENTTGTDPSGNACYEFQTSPSCFAEIKNLSITISTQSIPAGSTNYIQNTPSPTTATQVFSVATGTLTTDLAFSGTKNLLSTLGSQSFITANQITGGSFYMGWGAGASDPNATANNSTAFGNEALNGAGAPNSCTAFGSQTEASMTTGFENTAVGAFAMAFATSAQSNDAYGFRSLWQMTTATNNVAFGEESLENITTGSANTCAGWAACAGMTGNANSVTAMGFSAWAGTGNGGAFFGAGSGQRGTTATRDAFFGELSGQFVTSGTDNTLLGDNVAPTLAAGSKNTIIGSAADVGSSAVTNSICLGASCVVSSSNTAQIGGSGNNAVTVVGSTLTFSSGTITNLNFSTAAINGVQPYFILQSSQTVVQISSSTTSTVFIPTGIKIVVTPHSVLSRFKLQLSAQMSSANQAIADAFLTIMRNGVDLGSPSGSHGLCESDAVLTGAYVWMCAVSALMDAPATTSAVTYTIQIRSDVGSGTVTIGTRPSTVFLVEEYDH